MPRKRLHAKVPHKRKRLPIEMYAKKMRDNPTRAEKVLWDTLRRTMKRWNVVFIPQCVLLRKFIADFCCHELGLVIEVDGSIHQLAKVKAKDRYRTKILNENGYRVIRFSNSVVLQNTYSVIKHIEREIRR